MIVYNITLRIEPGIEKDWLNWQHQEHIPEIMASGYFNAYKFYRLLDQPAEELTYVIQYFADSMANYQDYIRHKAPGLREKALQRWGEKFIAFRTVMETVD